MAEYVFRVRNRIWVTLVALAVLGYGVWFGVVLFGEEKGWSDDPGAWAGLSTNTWAWLGLLVVGLSAIYFLLLLTRREVPSRTYALPGKPGGEEAPLIPSFLTRPKEEGPAPSDASETPPAVIEEPPAPPPA